jgi:hypothetical protein
MPEAQQMTFDEAGVSRTQGGTIADQSTVTPPSTPPEKPAETIVRPPATPAKEATTTTPSTASKSEAKGDGKAETKAPPEAPKSLLNEKGPAQGAPEKYEDFKVPEGFELDKDVATEFGTIAKGLNISQAGAQELVDFYVKQTKQANDAPYQAWTDVQEQWRDEINNDAEIGGSKLNAVRQSIGRMFDSLDPKVSDPFRQAMDYTGAGNNPAVVKFLLAVSRRLTEGGPVRGGGPHPDADKFRPGGGPPSAAQAIYPGLRSVYDQT